MPIEAEFDIPADAGEAHRFLDQIVDRPVMPVAEQGAGPAVAPEYRRGAQRLGGVGQGWGVAITSPTGAATNVWC